VFSAQEKVEAIKRKSDSNNKQTTRTSHRQRPIQRIFHDCCEGEDGASPDLPAMFQPFKTSLSKHSPNNLLYQRKQLIKICAFSSEGTNQTSVCVSWMQSSDFESKWLNSDIHSYTPRNSHR
jgi:hypothetical protein